MKEEIRHLENLLVELIQKYGLTATLEEQKEVIELGKELDYIIAKLNTI